MEERNSLHLSAEAKEEMEGLGVKVTLRFSRRMGNGGSSRLQRKGRRWKKRPRREFKSFIGR